MVGPAAEGDGDEGCDDSVSAAVALVIVGWGFGPIAPGFSPYFLTAHVSTGGDEALVGMALEARVARVGGGVDEGGWDGGEAMLGEARSGDCDDVAKEDGGIGSPK